MNLKSFLENLSDILTHNINAIYLTLFIVFISFIIFILFHCLRREKLFVDSRSNNQSSILKRKVKRKVNTLKVTRIGEISDNELSDIRHENRHIEIKSSPEIINDENNVHSINNPLLHPGKPILRKSESIIPIKQDECQESIWTIIPKDEVEILRSRHSSLASLVHLELKDDEIRNETKLSRGQRKRLKAKQKTTDCKQNENKNQMNNLTVLDDQSKSIKDKVSVIPTEQDDNLNKTNNDTKIDSYIYTKTASLTSSDSSQISEKMRSFSSMENDEKLVTINFAEDFPCDTFDDTTDCYSYQKFNSEFNNSEEKSNLEREIKDLKEEHYNLLQRLDEFPSMLAKIDSLKKDNELYLKKYNDLERTCNALKQELTSSIQKLTSTEGQLVRYKAEISQRVAYYENEMIKLSNKVNLLENDNRTKMVELETLKSNIEKLQFTVVDKEKQIQNQSIDMSSLTEQLYSKRKDCQDLESQLKNMNTKLNESENQKKLAYDETQKKNAQLETLKRDILKLQREFENFKRLTKAQEKQQDSIISSFQYQLDEYLREKKQAIFMNSGIENDISSSQISYKEIANRNDSNSVLLDVIKDDNRRLQEKCDNLESTVSEYKLKEASLEDENSKLSDRYFTLNNEFESHLKEIVSLRQYIETLQGELSKTSESTVEDLKLELDDKTDILRRTQESLARFEMTMQEKEIKWLESCNVTRQDNLKLENELRSQASLVHSQSKKILDLTALLQSYDHSQNESMFNGST